MLLAAAVFALQPADLVVTNATLWTDGQVVRGSFLAVRDGRFVHVGDPRPELVGPTTVRVNAEGRLVTPGVIDSHTHMVEHGKNLFNLNLRGSRDKAEFVRRVKDWNEKLPQGRWLFGTGWSAESWPEKQEPTKEWIDAVTGERPAVLTRMDGHSMLVNSAALKLSGITKDGPPNPAGGVIDRDPATNEPTGRLRNAAMGLIKSPGATPEETYEGLKAAVREANRYGVTAVSEICSTFNFALVRNYVSEPNPTLRFALYARTSDWPTTIQAVKGFKNVDGWVNARGLKVYMDGSLGSRTAFMSTPFNSQPAGKEADWRGLPMPGATDGTYRRGFQQAAENDLQVIVHAIGDQSNHDLLNMFSEVPFVQRKRFRIEHVQHLMAQDYPRFGQLGVIPSMQPYHKADDGRYCEEVIGEDRSRTSYAFRSLLKHRARLAFGSDWSVVTINPWAGIAAAVTSKVLTGDIWMPHERITFDQALDAYTRGSAYAMFAERELGRLEPGYRADFVVLNDSPYRSGVDLWKIAPVATYVEGRKAY
jgi:predicted amidohydrolase YtcJ